MSELHSPSRPEPVGAFVRPGSAPGAWPGTLPRPLTPLVGREREIDAVSALIRREDVRLVTLIGPGGVGKTRVAIATATSVGAEFADGIAFVDLSPVRDAAFVVPAIAGALGLHESSDQSLESVVSAFLEHRRMLLVIDNCEQVVIGSLVARLLRACPYIKVLTTSRIVLRVTGEQAFPIPPLAHPSRSPRSDGTLPPVADLAQFDAVALFVTRAQASDPAFALNESNSLTVAEICRALDGLPLAIELAAARLRLLTPEALLKRLIGQLGALSGGPLDQPTRLQTMRAAIAWSYDLLTEGERALFRRLAIFADGFSVDAAESVAGNEPSVDPMRSDPAFVLHDISSLVDHSLIRRVSDQGEPRFGMLETIRAFGLDQLHERGELGLASQRHATFYLQLAERADSNLTGPDQREWLDRLEAERGNLRDALEWSLAQDPRMAIRLAGALGRFWWTHGHLVEGRRWLAAVLEHESGTSAERARAHYAAGSLAGEQGEYREAISQLEAALAGFRTTDDRLGEALALTDLGLIARDQGDIELATAHHLAALSLRRAAVDRRGSAVSLSNLGTLALIQGDYDRATSAFAEAVESFRTMSDHRSLATAISMLSDVAMRRGEYDLAILHADEALRTMRPLGDQAAIATTLTTLAGCLRAKGMVTAAAARYEEALAHFRDLGHQRGAAAALSGLASARLDAGDFGQAVALLKESLDLLGPTGDRYLVLISLEETARLALAVGQAHPAGRLLGAADALRDSLGAPRSPSLESEHSPVLASVRAALDPGDWSLVFAEGAALSLAEAYQEAFALLVGLAVTPIPVLSTPVPIPAAPGGIYDDLTPREREVLHLLIEGRTDRDIAATLFVTTKTVSNHVASILSKLGVETRTAAAAHALRHGLA